jgi:recombination protein RecT
MRLQTFRQELARHHARIASLVPKHLTPERVFAVAAVAVSKSPELLQCTTVSVLRAIAIGAQLGLDVSGVGGQGYLVPFKSGRTGRYEATFIPGYQGLIELARRSREVVTVRAKEVYEKDDVTYEEGVVPILRHKPYMGQDPGNMVAVYAVAHFANGFAQPEVMSAWQVEAVRRRSRAAAAGPWATDTAAMWRKTAVKRLCKYLPQNPDLSRAIDVEERAEAGDEPLPLVGEEVEMEAPAPESVVEEVKNRLGLETGAEREQEVREPGEEG